MLLYVAMDAEIDIKGWLCLKLIPAIDFGHSSHSLN